MITASIRRGFGVQGMLELEAEDIPVGEQGQSDTVAERGVPAVCCASRIKPLKIA
jgi:hypothetical protein